MKQLVIKHKYNFKLISSELGISEEQARKAWTYFYCLEHKKSIPAKLGKNPNKNSSKTPSKGSLEAVTASDLLTSSRKKVDFLDHSDVDFTEQKSISVTGEVITPSGYCVLKHSLKDTFQQMRDRVIEFLPNIDGDDFQEYEEFMDFKVGMEGDTAIYQVRDLEDDWRNEVPLVPLPEFDDIHVIPEEDRPKPKVF